MKNERHEQREPSGFLSPDGSDHLIAAIQPVSRDGLTVVPQDAKFAHARLIPGWVISGGFRLDDHGLTITRLMISPADQDATRLGISSDLLRLIKLPDLALQIVALLDELDEHRRAAYEVWTGRDPGWDKPRRSHLGRPRRVDQADARAELKEVAIAYLAEIKGGPGVRRRVAQRIGRSEGAVAGLVRAARTDGWLTAAKHGSAHAAAGPRLTRERDFPECLTPGRKRSTRRK